MIKKNRFWFFIVFCLFLSPSYLGALHLQIYPEIGVNKKIIKIKDIGVFVKDKKDFDLFYLEDLILFETPKEKMILTNQELQKMISKKVGRPVLITGDRIVINPLYTLVLLQEVTEKIKTEVAKIYPPIARDSIDVIYVKSTQFEKVLASNFYLRVVVPRGKIGPVKYVRIEVLDGKEILLSQSVPIRLVFNVKQLVSKKNLNRHTRLLKNQFNVITKSIFDDPREYVSLDQLIQKKLILTKSLRQGSVLLKSNIE